jgi:hypothetical protein
VGSLHEECADLNGIIHNKSNREEDGEKRTGRGAQPVKFENVPEQASSSKRDVLSWKAAEKGMSQLQVNFISCLL